MCSGMKFAVTSAEGLLSLISMEETPLTIIVTPDRTELWTGSLDVNRAGERSQGWGEAAIIKTTTTIIIILVGRWTMCVLTSPALQT